MAAAAVPVADNNCVKVAIRIRPLLPREKENNAVEAWSVSDGFINQLDRNGAPGVLFNFDQIFRDKSNEEVYNESARSFVNSALEGIHSTIFAYGQTSSGKTFTMLGDDQHPGIIHYAVKHIFEHVSSHPELDFLISISFLEIYNERVIDLLGDPNKVVNIRQVVDVRHILQDAVEEVVTTPEQAYALLSAGTAIRKTGETLANSRSSRSHTVFRLLIQSKEVDGPKSQPIQISNLNLIDLAGSERFAQTQASGIQFKEGNNINKSLSVLSLCIKQMVERSEFINYRDSKLTRLLQNSFDGNAKTLMIANVALTFSEETHSTLVFANRIRAVKSNPQPNRCYTGGVNKETLNRLQSDLLEQINKNKKLSDEKMASEQMIDKLQEQIRASMRFNLDTKVTTPYVPKSQRRHTLGPMRSSFDRLGVLEVPEAGEKAEALKRPSTTGSELTKQTLVPVEGELGEQNAKSADVEVSSQQLKEPKAELPTLQTDIQEDFREINNRLEELRTLVEYNKVSLNSQSTQTDSSFMSRLEYLEEYGSALEALKERHAYEIQTIALEHQNLQKKYDENCVKTTNLKNTLNTIEIKHAEQIKFFTEKRNQKSCELYDRIVILQNTISNLEGELKTNSDAYEAKLHLMSLENQELVNKYQDLLATYKGQETELEEQGKIMGDQDIELERLAAEIRHAHEAAEKYKFQRDCLIDEREILRKDVSQLQDTVMSLEGQLKESADKFDGGIVTVDEVSAEMNKCCAKTELLCNTPTENKQMIEFLKCELDKSECEQCSLIEANELLNDASEKRLKTIRKYQKIIVNLRMKMEEENIEEKRQIIGDLERKCNDLKVERDDLERERDELKKEHDELKVQRDELEVELEVLKKKCDDLKVEGDDLKKKCNELEVERGDLKVERADLNKKRDKLEVERDELEVEREVLKKKCDDLKVERDYLKVERDELKKEHDELEVQRDELEVELEVLKQKCDDLKVERDDLKKKCNELEVERGDLEVKRADLNKKRDELEVEREVLKKKCDDLEAERDDLKVERDDLIGERDDLKKKCNDLKNKCDDLLVVRENLERELDDTTKERDRFKTACDHFQMERDERQNERTLSCEGHKKTIEEQQQKLVENSNEIKMLRNEIEVHSALNKYEGKAPPKPACAKCAKLQLELKDLKTSYENLEVTMVSIRKASIDKMIKIKNLEEELSNLKLKESKKPLQEQKQASCLNCSQWKKRAGEVEFQLADFKHRCYKQEDRCEKLEASRIKYKDYIKKQHDEITKLNENNQNLLEECLSLKTTAQSYEDLYKTYQSQLIALKNKETVHVGVQVDRDDLANSEQKCVRCERMTQRLQNIEAKHAELCRKYDLLKKLAHLRMMEIDALKGQSSESVASTSAKAPK